MRTPRGGTTVTGTTPAETTTPRNPIPMTGTWYGRMGMRPYELLDPSTTTHHVAPGPSRTLPAHILAA